VIDTWPVRAYEAHEDQYQLGSREIRHAHSPSTEIREVWIGLIGYARTGVTYMKEAPEGTTAAGCNRHAHVPPPTFYHLLMTMVA